MLNQHHLQHKIPVPGSVEKIFFPRVLKNADAIRSIPNNKLVIFESNAFGNDGAYGGQISLADPNDFSLTTVINGLNDPSSGIIVGNRIYFIESKYQLLLREQPDDTSHVPTHVPFSILSQPLPK